MCYINLSHILYFTKFITHKFLIKWQGVFAQPLLIYLSDKPRRSKISRTLETHWSLVAHYQPDQGSASRAVHITRFLKSRIQALGWSQVHNSKSFLYRIFECKQPQLCKKYEISPVWNYYFQLLSHSPEMPLACDVALCDKQSQIEYWQWTSQEHFALENWLVWNRYSKVLII